MSLTETFVRRSDIIRMISRKPDWPDPQNSIGLDDCGLPFYGKTLWLLHGPALVAYNAIEQDIEDCINELGTELYNGAAQSFAPHSLGCFMWGKRKTKANPYVIISCAVERICYNIKSAIENQDWWERFKECWPGFGRFLLSDCPPGRYGADGKSTTNQELIHVFASWNTPLPYSVPLFFRRTDTPRSAPLVFTTVDAKLGGVIFLDDKPFGLTVSHATKNREETRYVVEKIEHVSKLFYVDSDDDSDSEDDDDDEKGSLSVNTSAQSEAALVSAAIPVRTTLHNPDKSAGETLSSQPLGELTECSDDGDKSDWGLVDIYPHPYRERITQYPVFLSNPYIIEEFHGPIYAPRFFKDLPNRTTPIFLVNGSGELISGSLSATHTLVQLEKDQGYKRLATALTNKVLSSGDCGMWVFDRDGNLYGHVVAGSIGSGIIYLAPILEVLDDIRSLPRFSGSQVRLGPRGLQADLLETAVYEGSQDKVELWLKKGADANHISGYGRTLLYEAVNRRSASIVHILLRYGAHFGRGHHQQTPLIRACELGAVPIVKMLLNAGADVNEQSESRDNALQAASLGGHMEIVRVLIKAGADLNAKGGLNGNALQAASSNGHKGIVQMLLDAGAAPDAQGGPYSSALQTAVIFGYQGIVQVLLNAGADPNTQGGLRGHALRAASRNGHKKIVQMLLNAGAEVNELSEVEGDAISAASYAGHQEIIQILLDAGADPNALGGPYSNALQAASHNGYKAIVQMLLDAGADPGLHGRLWASPVQVASANGHEEIVQMLLGRIPAIRGA